MFGFGDLYQLSEADMEFFESHFGRKTLDEIRGEVGLPPCDDGAGGIVYVDWLRNRAGLGPKLKIVQNLD